jgi:hypothetical protein
MYTYKRGWDVAVGPSGCGIDGWWDRGDVLIGRKFSDVGTSGYPFHGSFIRAPFGIQRLASDSRDIRSLGGFFQLSGVDDDCEMFFVIFVVMVQVKECGPVRGGYTGTGHALHLNVVLSG